MHFFILSALGHCCHDNSLKSTFLPLYFLSFFHSNIFISTVSLFDEPLMNIAFPPPLLPSASFSFHANSPITEACYF